MKSIIEPIELALLKALSEPFAENGIKTYANYYEEDIKKGFTDTKIQDLGNRAFVNESESIVILYKRTSPLVRSSTYGKNGMDRKLIAIDRETNLGFEKDYIICDWEYDFSILSKYRGNEEFTEFIFNFYIKRMKRLNFILRIKDFDIPLSFSLNIGDINSYEKMDEGFLDNVYTINFTLSITGMILSPFSRDNSVGAWNGKFELYLFGESTTFDLENDSNQLISVITDEVNDLILFSDPVELPSVTNEVVEIPKEL